MKKIVLTTLFNFFCLCLFAQQNAQFGQYMFNGLYINPAYAGYKEELYMQAFVRAQWTGIQGAPQTLSISVDEAVKEESLGLGLLVSKDKIGAQNSLNLSGNFAYRIKLDRTETNILAFGVGIGVMQMGLNGNLLDPNESGDNKIPTGYESRIVHDIRAGVHYSNEKFFIGFSANNLLTQYLPVFRDNNLLSITSKPHFYLTAGMIFPIDNDFMFKPTFLIKDDLNGPTSLDLNAFLMIKEKLWLGAAYRTSIKLYPKSALQGDLRARSAIGLVAEFFIRENLRIGYGYDYSLNKLGNYDYGSHEISIGYYLQTAKSRRPKCYF
ncbi:type IX secretion system membrane protein PorP/SprF [Pedobacter riviphilus]|uniref:Type IX secretion system membrane protein PorP/SprF n=1 Tax=Pedobacter riviphilus TaxID=2766984 RepID=A0ABX6TIS3_9SPHI|nr:type IX secretion system membrane protein PorP/SprF [Pedobacter riviphilus]QNR85373.1 type IX secretion system membrane protein PorP/SprF [Pedobacter riviphilus]